MFVLSFVLLCQLLLLLSFPYLIADEAKEKKHKFFLYLLFVCAYSKLSHCIFPSKYPATLYFDVVFFSLFIVRQSHKFSFA
jgi:hypothetical protein